MANNKLKSELLLQPFKVLHYCFIFCGIDLMGSCKGYKLWILRVYRIILIAIQLLVTYTTTSSTVNGFSKNESMSKLSISLAGCVHMFSANTMYYIVVYRAKEIRKLLIELMQHLEAVAAISNGRFCLEKMRQKLFRCSWVLCTFVVLYCCTFLAVAQYGIFGEVTRRLGLISEHAITAQFIKSVRTMTITSALTVAALMFCTVGFTMILLVLFINICFTLDRMFTAFNEGKVCGKMHQSALGMRQTMKCHEATCQLVRNVEHIFSPIIFLCIGFGSLGVCLQIRSVLLDINAGVSIMYYFQISMYLIFFLMVWIFAARLNVKV